MKFEVIIDRNFARHSTDVFIYSKDEVRQTITVLEPVEMIMKTMGNSDCMEIKPSLSFNDFQGDNFLEAFSEALIKCGYRDKSISKDGEIKRLESHLEDMRKISFKFIEKV